MKLLNVVLLTISLTGCAKIPEDSLPEELLEEIIESKIGIDIDLSPNSPEIRK